MSLDKEVAVGDSAANALTTELVDGKAGVLGISAGVGMLCRVMRSCYGPKRSTVALTRMLDTPVLVSDALLIAKGFELPQALANLGVKFLNDAVSRMDQRVGDGCTLTAILLDEILREGWRRLSAGVSVQELTDGINLSSETVVAELEGHLLPVSEGDLTTALTRAAQLNENLASCLRQALEHVGVDGVILIKESKRVDSTVDLIEGLRFPKGYASPLFAADEESGEIRLRQALIFLTDRVLEDEAVVERILKRASDARSPVVVIAPGVASPLLAVLVRHNLAHKDRKVVVVDAPEYGDQRTETLHDLAALTGCMVFDAAFSSFEGALDEFFGAAAEVAVHKDSTLIRQPQGRSEWVEVRRRQVSDSSRDPGLSAYDQERRLARLGLLKGKTAIISVGGQSDVEVGEALEKVQRLVKTIRVGVQRGVVAGSGAALVSAGSKIAGLKLSSVGRQGIEVMMQALEHPTRQLLTNAALDSADIQEIIARYRGTLKSEHVYDVTRRAWVSPIEANILDSLDVLQASVRTAASIACSILSVGMVVHRATE